MSPQIDIAALWRHATEVVFERSDRFGPLNQSMRAAVPIALEGNTLIVGLSGTHQYLAGHLQTPANRHRVLEVLRELSGKPLELRMIEGTTLEDWEAVHKAEESQRAKGHGAAPVAARPTHAQPPGHPPEAAGPWEQWNQNVHFAWQSWPHHTQPIARAQFVRHVLPWLVETEARAARQGDAEDAIQRGLTRALERLSGMCDIPIGALALEFLRLPKQPAPAARPEKKGKK